MISILGGILEIKRNILPKLIKNILVIRNGALGDFILTLPVFNSLKKAFPHARIEVMGNPANLALAQGYVDGVIPSNIAGLYTLYDLQCTIPQNIRQLLGKFDLVISYNSDSEGHFIQNLRRIGIPWIINGTFSSKEKLPSPVSELLLLPLKKEGIPIFSEPPRINLSHLDRKFAQRFFHSLPNSGNKPFIIIAIHPGSGSPKKCWPIENFIQLASWTNQSLGAKIILITGPAENHITKSLHPFIESYKPMLIDKPALNHLAAILEKSTVYVGNDSGITHLAAAVGTPTLALFGPTDYRIWGPKNENVKFLQSSHQCAPCSPQQMARCPKPNCMNSISIDLVKKALLSLIPRPCKSLSNNNTNAQSFRRERHYV